jgi:hypothetical protein
MKLDIIPFQSVGAMEFGASPESIRAVLNSSPKSFVKGSLSDKPTATDAFDEVGIHVYYDESNKCEAIEFFSPALLTFQEKELVGQPYKAVSEWLASIDANIVRDDSGLEARSLGIGLYAPDYDENERPDGLVESAIVVKQGYWS